MIAALAKTIFGSSNDRYVAKLGKTVETALLYTSGPKMIALPG